MSTESKADTVDEGLYSRQLYVVGKDAMLRMQQYSVLITGMNGLGVEIAKNTILAGVKSVTIHDDALATLSDLSSQFYLDEGCVGQPRAAACLSKLKDLNQYVSVHCITGPLTDAVVKNYNLVVVVNALSESELVRLNALCRSLGVHFIATASHGLLGYAFTDLGDAFVMLDKDGEKVKEGAITNISDDGVVEAEVHELADGDYVTFSHVEGMSDLNDGVPRVVKVVNRDSFRVEGVSTATAGGKYVRGGYFREAKQPSTLKFASFEACLLSPALTPNFLDFNRPSRLLALQRGLWRFAESHGGRLPAPHNVDEAGEVVKAAEAFLAAPCSGGAGSAPEPLTDKERGELLRLAAVSAGNLNPMAAVFGGIVGQEIIKSSSGKFTPIMQFYFHDAVEALGDEFPLPARDVTPPESRYSGQVAVFGAAFQGRIADLRVFLVGAGALGCEFLKNFALCGLATSSSGNVLVTDMDSIEKSNLNRQFLFRPKDVGQMKSSTAAAAATAMNPAFRVTAVCDKIATDTEDKYDIRFWEGLDVVVSALDNVQARVYIDSKCVEARRPLLESGTLGTKCHTQNILPHKTMSYGSTTDPQDNSFPVCTLKFFPNLIEHTLQWARDEFELLFHNNPEEINSYLTRGDHMADVKSQRATALERLSILTTGLMKERPRTFEDCVVLARNRFEDSFKNNILQLLEQYPLDYCVSDGQPFWSAKKRPPTPVDFNVTDPLHMQYIVAAANLYARMYGIPECDDVGVFVGILPGIVPPPFVPSKKKIAANDEEAKKLASDEAKAAQMGDLDGMIEAAASLVPPASAFSGLTLTVEEFEKDNDANRHMHFIAAAGNLRARQYRIPEADNLKAKLIVGRIVPAVATTTALATGLVMLELYKVLANKPIEAFRDSNVNLGINQFAAFEPPSAAKKSYRDVEYTLWDTMDIEASTMGDVVEYFRGKEFELLMVSTTGGDTVVLFDANDFEGAEAAMEKGIGELYEEVTGKALPPAAKYLQVDVLVEDTHDPDAEVNLPPVRIRL